MLERDVLETVATCLDTATPILHLQYKIYTRLGQQIKLLE